MLHPINRGDWDRTVWCGPGVLSILTGKPVRETHAILGRHCGTTAEKVSAVPIEAILLALYEQDFLVREVDLAARYSKPPTLRRYLRERPTLPERLKMVLVLTHEHVGACHLNYYCDNHTQVVMHQDNCLGGRRPVEQAWILTPIPPADSQ